MKTDLREFNDEGIRIFRDYLNKIKNNDMDQDFQELLSDSRYTTVITTASGIEPWLPPVKLEAARYLHGIIRDIPLENKFYRPGLWTWLSAYYFDFICPAKPGKPRNVMEEARYILIPGRHVYRHLLAGPVQIFDSYGDSSHILLSGDVAVMGDYIEQLAGRIFITSGKGIVQAIDLLYWDFEKKRPASGATSRTKPGNIRRFTDIIGQFCLTYDMTSMDGFEIVSLLPGEFEKYKENLSSSLFE